MRDEQRDHEDPRPPRARLDKAYPDLVHGFKEAPAGVQHVLRDATERLERRALDRKAGIESCGRIIDIRIHTQAARQHRSAKEKRRVENAATDVLDECLIASKGTPAEEARWAEAMSALEKEDERVFVAVVIATPVHLVYWNWRFAYSVPADNSRRETRRFRDDVEKRKVANAENASRRYGKDAR